MDTITIFLIFIGFSFIWFWHCLSKAISYRKAFYDKIREMLNKAKTKEQIEIVWDAFEKIESISLEKHIWHLFTFRDENKLYQKD